MENEEEGEQRQIPSGSDDCSICGPSSFLYRFFADWWDSPASN
jgi:hypothetical protein